MEFLKQRKLFVSKNIELTEDGVNYHSKDLEDEYSRFFDFSQIEPRTKCRIYVDKYPKLLYTGLIITAIALLRGLMSANVDLQKALVVSSVVMSFGLLTVLAYYIVRIRYYLIELEDETQLFLLYNKPNEQEFNQFIDLMYEYRKQNYRKNYFFINIEKTKDSELAKMEWLLDEKIISDSEYRSAVSEINLKLCVQDPSLN